MAKRTRESKRSSTQTTKPLPKKLDDAGGKRPRIAVPPIAAPLTSEGFTLSSWRPHAIWAVLIAVTVAVFAPVVTFDFVNFDDHGYIVENPYLKPPLTLGVIGWAFTTGRLSNWHPLTWLSYALDVSLFGIQAGGFHATSLLIHLINVVLLFEILRRMTGAPWRSACVAALFAIHPLHVESVTWIAERKDVLSGCFFMLTLAAYTAYARRGGLTRYILVATMLALGLMAKAMLVTLPFVLLLLDYWPLARITFPAPVSEIWQCGRRLVLEKIPLFAIVVASSVVTFLAQQHGGGLQAGEHFSFEARIGNALVSYCVYLLKTVWPSHLAVFYPHLGDKLPAWEPLLATIVLAGLTALVIVQSRKRPVLIVGWFWYVGMLVPVIGLVQVGLQAMADRYTYLTLIGIFIAVVWTVAEAAGALRVPRMAVAGGACAVLAVFAVIAGFQVQHWRDSDTLMNHALAVTQDNCLAHYNLGVELLQRGQIDEAETHFRETLRIEPNHAKGNSNMGNVLCARNRTEEALTYFSRAMQAKPDLADAYYNMGTALMNLKRTQEAIPYLQKSIELQPDDQKEHFNLGNALQATKQYPEAIEAYRRALAINPAFWEAQLNLGNAFQASQKYDEAVAEYQKAIRLKPQQPLPYMNMGHALAMQSKWEPAHKAFQQTLKLDPNNAEALDAVKRLEDILAAQAAASQQPPKPATP